MAKKKNYLSNAELRDEIIRCITDGFEKAVSYGFDTTLPVYDPGSSEEETGDEKDAKPKKDDKTIKFGYLFESDDPEMIEKYELAVNNGYVPERSYWIRRVKNYDKEETNGIIHPNDELKLQMAKPIVSAKLANMFQLIVDNIAKSFYWANPDDGDDCKANAILDLCSNFWKYEPADGYGRPFSAFAFCSQVAYYGIAGAHRILHPKKYNGTISISCLDENGKPFELYNL